MPVGRSRSFLNIRGNIEKDGDFFKTKFIMRRRKKRRWNGAIVNTSSDVIIVMMIFVICQ